MPIFGIQGSSNSRWSFYLPCDDPIYRFSSTNGITFTDLNEDGWPDLIVTGKGYKASPYHNVNDPDLTGHWLDQTMIYINRGNDSNGRWMGFWNRTWDMLLQAKDYYRRDRAPMGLAIADYDMDGHMDFIMSDLSDPSDNTPTELVATADLYRNAIWSTENLGLEMQDLRFYYSGEDGPFHSPATPLNNLWTPGFFSADMHGPHIMTSWFSWGMLFADFDNDGDQDSYICSQYGETVQGQNSSAPYILEPFTAGLRGGSSDPGRAYDRLFENRRIGNAAIFDPDSLSYDESAQFHDYNPDDVDLSSPPRNIYKRPYLIGRAARRFDTHNVLFGDYDLDGRIDYAALPGPINISKSLQVFHNETPSPGGMLRLHLAGNPVAIGARITIKSKLNGTDFQTQYLELRAGENHGTSTNSLALEVGIGQHPSGTSLTVDVDWPSGRSERFGIVPNLGAPLNHDATLSEGTGALLPSAPWNLGPLSYSSGDPADGIAPVLIKTTANNPASIASSELTICPVGGIARWIPVSMDHVPNPTTGELVLELIPLRFPVVYNDVNTRLVPKEYYARVRSLAKNLEMQEVMTDGSGLFTFENNLEARLFDGNTWSNLQNAVFIPLGNGDVAIDICPNGTADCELVFPGEPDGIDYHLVLKAESQTLGNGVVEISCPNLNLNPMIFSAITPSGPGNNPRYHQILHMPPHRGGGIMITITNTGNETVRLIRLDRGRSETSTCLQ